MHIFILYVQQRIPLKVKELRLLSPRQNKINTVIRFWD